MRAINFTKRITPFIFLPFISVGCGGYSSSTPETVQNNTPQGNTPQGNSSISIDALIGTVSLSSRFSGTSDEFEDIVTFTDSNIVQDVVELERIVQVIDGNVITRCQHIADTNMFQCTVAESTPQADSSLISYDYKGGRSGRGWALTGTITLDNGLFGSIVEDRDNGLTDWRFNWSDANTGNAFSVDSSQGILLRLTLEIGESGELGATRICGSATNDPSLNCQQLEAAPWFRVNNNYSWIASTVGSVGAAADSRRGIWSPVRSTEAEIVVTSYLFSLDSEGTGTGVFEFCTAQSSIALDPDSIAKECAQGLIDEPDGEVTVALRDGGAEATQRTFHTQRLVSGVPMEGGGINDYKLVYDQATGGSLDFSHESSIDVQELLDTISNSIQQSLVLK